MGSTGSETKFSSGKDGYLARLEKGEMVFNNPESDELRSMGYSKRTDVINAIKDYEIGNTWAFMPRLQQTETPSGLDLSEIVKSNDRVVKAIQDNAVHIENDYHGLNEWIEKRLTAHGIEITKFILKKFKR